MKGRESGMPERDIWDGFFNPEKILGLMGINQSVGNVVEFGCGYGTFTIPAAKLIKGKVFALDIDHDMIRETQEEAKKQKLNNIVVIKRDFVEDGTSLEDEVVNYVMLFNILHIEDPGELLRESWRVLKPEGKVGIIHWSYDPNTPRGPSMVIRPKPQQCIEWARMSGFGHPEQYELKPYHYGIVLRKG